MQEITIVGGGIAGLVAAIAAAEAGTPVRLVEAHAQLGGRARSTEGPYKANLGPHVLYKDGPLWGWLKDKGLLPRHTNTPLGGIRVRYDGEIRRTPPLGSIPTVLRLRGREAPVDRSFRAWVTDHADERTADMLSAAAGVYTFHHDPGELSAAFVWARTVRTLLNPPPVARYIVGGWGAMVATMEQRARALGVQVDTGVRLDALPHGPVVVATELDEARRLLGDDELHWPSGHTVCLDVGLEHRRGDPFVVSDLDECGWLERFTSPDPSLAPDGEELIQAQMPIRPGESVEDATARLEQLCDASLDGWRERTTWRRRQVMHRRTGALDLPGTTWRDRPAIDRGDGVFLAGDTVGAPGLLAEVAFASGVEAAKGALAHLGVGNAVRAAA
jgi:phytoene dehydrogenase-like protein